MANQSRRIDDVFTPELRNLGTIYRLHMCDRKTGEISRSIMSEDYTWEEAEKTYNRFKKTSLWPDDIVTIKIEASIVLPNNA